MTRRDRDYHSLMRTAGLSSIALTASFLVTSCTSAPPLADRSASQGAPEPTIRVSSTTWTGGRTGPQTWPLTVDEGVLRCHSPYQLTFTAGGIEYALNGSARASGQFHDIRDVEKYDGYEVGSAGVPQPAKPFTVTRMIELAFDLCPTA